RGRYDRVAALIAAADAEPSTELAREIVRGNDDARFDEHLLHGLVEFRHEVADLGDAFRRVDDEQGVRALVVGHATALGQEATRSLRDLRSARALRLLRLLGQQIGDVPGLAVA